MAFCTDASRLESMKGEYDEGRGNVVESTVPSGIALI